MNRPRDRIGLAILLVVGAVALFSILNAEVKILRADFGSVQLVWARYIGALLFMVAVFTPMRGPHFLLLRTARPAAQILRGACLLAASLCFFLAIKWVPLATAAAITMLGPVFITALSGPVLGERVGPRRWSAVVIGFVGALVIIRPGFGDTPWQIVFTLGSAISSAFYALLTRKLSAGEDAATSATIATVVGTAALSLVVWSDWRAPSGAVEIGMIASLGLLSGLGHYLYTVALGCGPASVIAPFNYSHLIFAALLGFIVFGYFPDLWSWAGAGLIVASGLYIGYREAVLSRRAGEPGP